MLTLVICNTEKLRHGEKLTAMVSLPTDDEQLLTAASTIGLPDFKHGQYHYDKWSFDEGMEKLNPFISKTMDIQRLNLLTHVLTGFSEDLLRQYEGLLSGHEKLSAYSLINEAYNIKGGRYEFWPAYDYESIGRCYVRTLPNGIPEALEGYIDFEQAGRDFQNQTSGKLTDAGYICNYNEDFPPTFDGTNLDMLLAEARKELGSQQMGGMEL